MPTRSLIGILSDDGRSYRARYCHSDGYPTHMLPVLGEALHKHHAGDLAPLAAALLRHDWAYLAPGSAADEAHDGGQRSDRLQPTAGVGFHYAGSRELEPINGTLDEDAGGSATWLYLISGDEIRVHYETGGAWAHFGDYGSAELAHLDPTDLIARESAVTGRRV
ncbi:hypothetical protein [Amycolatopsis sp. NPDC004079]|uniref:hypothetical protein n=1 Tax=Amycolatopsis sp. NPDC004079 TaxID=3154549 RepID=UPI0033B3E53A